MSDDEQLVSLLEEAGARIETLERILAKRMEPLAIVGMSCRFPGGANSPKQYWNLLRQSASGVREVPADRWDIGKYYDPDPDAPGKMSTRMGGFLRDMDFKQFDTAYFGISPKEAQSIDPQQRLVLECVVEAFEDAGIPLDTLVGSRTGVFLGVSTTDFANLQQRLGTEMDPYSGTGIAHSVVAGRVSYCLGLQGPAMSIDTACSSSLYALHQACASLRSGESDLAIVAGVNVLLDPGVTVYFSKGRFMAPDGQCKTFDASADGYVRSEGVGVVVLQRSADAQRQQRRTRAIIRGSAINQDGRSSALTAPNGPSQEAVIRAALEQSGLRADEVSYVEAHGTGTQLGDPIEVNALAGAYGAGRSASRPLLIGSVKTNIGHLEAAAGMASVIKLVLSLEHGEIPGQRNLQRLNPKIAWNELPLSVVTRGTRWERQGGNKRIAGASAFAFQGSNAHVIIEEAPQQEDKHVEKRAFETLVISAKSEEALKLNVEKWTSYLDETSEHLTDIAYTALHHRALFETKLVLEAKDTKDAAQKLRRYLKGESVEGVRTALESKTLEALKAEAKAAGGERVDIPTYAFLRKRHWLATKQADAREERSYTYELAWQKVEGQSANDSWSWLRSRIATVTMPVRRVVLVGDDADTKPAIEQIQQLSDSLRVTASSVRTLQEQGLKSASEPIELVYVAPRGVSATSACLDLVECFKQVKGHSGRVWLVSQQGQNESLNALLRVMSLEDRQHVGKALSIEPDAPMCEALVNELSQDDGEEQVLYKGYERQVQRLVEKEIEQDITQSVAREDWVARENKSYLVTGGLSGLGLELSGWLVQRGARELILTGRRGLVTNESELTQLEAGERSRQQQLQRDIQKLEQSGCRVRAVSVDVADAAAMHELFAEAQRNNKNVDAVFHLAGVSELGFSHDIDQAALDRAMRGKVGGGIVLDTLTRQYKVDTLLMYGSGAAVWGGAGQGAYAAANGALKDIAQRREQDGHKTIVLEWGPIVGTGMASEEEIHRLEQGGIRALRPETLHRIVGDALGESQRQTTPKTIARVGAAFDWEQFLSVYEAKGSRHLLDKIRDRYEAEKDDGKRKAKRKASIWADRLRSADAATQRQALETEIIAVVSETLGKPTNSVAKTEGFQDLGVDSLMAVEIRSQLNKRLGAKLSATIVFDHPTVEALSTALWRQLFAEYAEEQGRQISQRSAGDDAIAIIGMGCRLPGGVHGPEGYWRLLREGGDASSEVPHGRWATEEFYDASGHDLAKSITKRGGFVTEIEAFDAQLFGISPAEARAMDPQQRMVLESVYQALNQANISPETLKQSKTGVFVGVSSVEYTSLGNSETIQSPFAATGGSLNAINGRVSFLLGLQGPSLAVDTACSSSLSALHLGCRSLSSGESDMVLAGGVNALLNPSGFIVMSRAGAISPDGRCKSFSDNADGYGRGEGCGMFVLKRQSDAERDGDRILAAIKGTAINQDGRSSGFTAPNGPAQQAVIEEALKRANLRPQDIDYLEAHGTGTKLGDPIEVQAAAEVLGKDRDPKHPLMLGTSKSNLGHLESAAGAAALMKVVLSLQNETLPKTLHADALNRFIPWDELPVAVLTKAVPWRRTDKKKRSAGISSFGISGTNAHVIIEEAPQQEDKHVEKRAFETLVISAKSEAALMLNAEKWESYLEETSEHLTDVAYTALHHRVLFETKLVVDAKDTKDAAQKLRRYIKGEPVEGLRTALNAQALESLKASAKAAGGERVDIPTYVFLRKRYWVVETRKSKQRAVWTEVSGSPDGLGRRVFEMDLSPEVIPDIRDHVAFDRMLIPGSLYLSRLLELTQRHPELGNTIANVAFETAVGLKTDEHAVVRLSVEQTSQGVCDFEIVGQKVGADEDDWSLLGTGQISESHGQSTRQLIAHSPTSLTGDAGEIYEAFAQGKLFLGKKFRWMERGASFGDYAVVQMRAAGEGEFSGAALPPGLVDSAFQGGLFGAPDPLLLLSEQRDRGAQVFVGIRSIRQEGQYSGEPLVCHVFAGTEAGVQDVVLHNADNSFMLEGLGVRGRTAPADNLYREQSAEYQWVHEQQWVLSSEERGLADNAPLVIAPVIKEGASLSGSGAVEQLAQRISGASVVALSAEAVLASAATHLVILVASTDAVVIQDSYEHVTSVLRPIWDLVRNVLAAKRIQRLTFVTQRAQRIGAQPVVAAHATLWGFARTLAKEFPDVFVRMIDCADLAGEADHLVEELRRRTNEDEVCLRRAERYVARLKKVRAKDIRAAEIAPDGAYLISGGLGGLGLAFGEWLVKQGARHVVLMARRPPDEQQQATIDAMKGRGALVDVALADIEDEKAVRTVVDDARRRSGGIAGVIHAAGRVHDGLLDKLEWPAFEAVMRPKIQGLLNLSAAAKDAKWFVSFSSTSALFGNGGQANYAAANSFLDAFAQNAPKDGPRHISIAWGAWADIGMMSRLKSQRGATKSKDMSVELGLSAFRLALGSSIANPSIFAPDWRRLAQTLSGDSRVPPKIIEHLRAHGFGLKKAADSLFARELHALPETQRLARVERLVREQIGEILGSPVVDMDKPLMELGVDSLSSIELRNRLQAQTELKLPSTLIFEHPTGGALARALLAKVVAVPGADPKTKSLLLATSKGESSSAAVIVGLGCLFANGVDTPERFWDSLTSGSDSVTEIPPDRWDVDEYYDPTGIDPNKMATKWGAFVEGVDRFDREFFGITPHDAAAMDPQQRLLLEVAAWALEDAGIDYRSLAGTRTGVFTGIFNEDYRIMQARQGPSGAIASTASDPSGASSTLSRLWALKGPAISVNTLCSSSLVALHLARQSLLSGECDTAIVCGVNLVLSPEMTISLSRMQVLSPTGRSRSFSDDADGYVRGEGCGVVVLKRRQDAEAAGMRIRAIVRGIAVNQDGDRSSRIAPNGSAQAAVMRQALNDAGVTPNAVSYLEAFCVGSSMGDAIELNAVQEVYGASRRAAAPIVLGTVKSNMGHLEGAAGVAGIIKTVMALEHGELVQSLHFAKPTTKVNWADASMVVSTMRRPWLRGRVSRIAAISGFGMSGTNAHVIIEEAPRQDAKRVEKRAFETLIVSAKSEAALKLNVEKWASYLEQTSEHLTDIAYTALHHRPLFETKLVLDAKDTKEAAQKLRRYLKGESVEGVRTAIDAKTLEALKTEAKAAGGERVEIPTYAFLLKRYWVEETQGPKLEGETTGYELLGAEVEQADGSTRRIFTSEVRPSWPSWLKDHVVQGEVVLPGAAQVELLAEAAKTVLGAERVTLKDVAIERALIIKEPMRIQTVVETDGSVVVYGRQAKAKGSWQVYARGQMAACEEKKPAAKVLPELVRVDETTLYGSFDARGLRYGEAFRTLVATGAEPNGTSACLVESKPGSGRFVLSPMLLDGCLQSIAGAMGKEESNDAYLPFGFSRIHVFTDAAPNTLIGRVELVSGRAGHDEIVRANITLTQKDGEVVCIIEDASFKRARQGAIAEQATTSRLREWLYELAWQEQSRSGEVSKSAAQSWLVVSEDEEQGIAQHYVAMLVARGLKAESGRASELRGKLDASALVWITPRADEEKGITAETVKWRMERTLKTLLHATQGLLKEQMRLYVVTEGAQAVAGHPVKRPWQSAVWGYLRVLANEAPELRPVLIDVQDYSSAGNELSWELVGEGKEDEVGLYEGQRYVQRLTRYRPKRLVVPSSENWAVMPRKRGQLDALELQTVRREGELSGRQVEVAVDAVGVNFRDVLNAMGVYPGEPGDLGGDLAGRVSRVGPEVRTLAVGDAVYGLAPGALRKYVVSDERLLVKTPARLSAEQASTLVSTFLTLKLGVEEIGKLKKGERILIHAAAGGVGLAAIQVARHLGAEIYATASEPKHAHLRALGITHIYNSRSSAFYDEIMNDTGGEGIDMVLNSLTGEKLEKSMKLLRQGGRFIEIGKAEILSESQARAINAKASYHAVALDGVAAANPDWFIAAYAELNERIESKVFEPLQHEVHAVTETREVFRRMAQGKHIGKVVIALKERALVSPAGSYVVSGGLGAIGQELSVWLAEQGARDIVLLGRSAPSESAKKNIAKAEALGCRVTVAAVDVSNEAALERVMQATRKRAGKITGIMHAAGVLQDATIKEQSWEKFEQVLTPKAVGIELLSKLAPEAETIQCFGSIAAVIGNGGQANYAAANSYLDGFAQQHPSKAQSTAWWAWAEGGMAKALQDKRSQNRMDKALSMQEGVQLLAMIMSSECVQPVVFGVEPQTLAKATPQSFQSAKYKELVKQQNGDDNEFASRIRSAPVEQRQKQVRARVLQEVQAVLGTQTAIEADKPLMDLGVDSLMAVELRNRLSTLIGQTLPSSFVFDFPSIEAMTGSLVVRVIGESSATGTMPSPKRVSAKEIAERLRLLRKR